jgi:hypothetical protein
MFDFSTVYEIFLFLATSKIELILFDTLGRQLAAGHTRNYLKISRCRKAIVSKEQTKSTNRFNSADALSSLYSILF